MNGPAEVVAESGERHIIRAVSPVDEAAVAELASTAFGPEVGVKAGEAVRDLGGPTGLLGSPRERPIHANYWVAIAENGRIDGMVGLYSPRWIGPQSLYLGWYAVRPERRGIGLGRALFDLAQAQAVALGARAILTETADEPAATVAFYRHVGFRDVAHVPDYWEDGSPLRLMRYALNPAEISRHRSIHIEVGEQ